MTDVEHSDLVTVAQTVTLQQADVVAASLRAAKIPAMVHGERTINLLAHMGPAIHPCGVRVMVLPEYAEQARALIAEADAQRLDEPEDVVFEEDGGEPVKVSPAEVDAGRAYSLGICSIIFSVLFPFVVFYALRALVRSVHQPLVRPRTFAWHLTVGLLLSAAGAAIAGWIILLELS